MIKLAVPLVSMVILLSCCGGGAPLDIENDLRSYDIVEIYVYPDSSSLRGFNILTSPLRPGDTFRTRVEPGIYNVAVIDEDGDSYHYPGLMVVSSGYELGVGLDDLNRGVIHTGDGYVPFRITSGLPGGASIYYAYVSMTPSDWGADRLRSTIMLPDEELVVWITPGTWNAKVETDQTGTYIIEDVVVGDSGFHWEVTTEDLSGF